MTTGGLSCFTNLVKTVVLLPSTRIMAPTNWSILFTKPARPLIKVRCLYDSGRSKPTVTGVSLIFRDDCAKSVWQEKESRNAARKILVGMLLKI